MAKYSEHFRTTLLNVVEVRRKTIPNGSKEPYWNYVLQVMQEKFPMANLTEHGLRSLYKRLTNPRVRKITRRKDDARVGRIKLEDRLLPLIKKKRSLAYVAGELEVKEDKILEAVARLQIGNYRGVTVWDEGGTIYIQNVTKPRTVEKDVDLSHLTEGNVVTFAVVSDTHFGSNKSAVASLHSFYDYVASLGVNTVLHIGDLSDGYYTNRPTSIMEQDAIGFQAQLAMLVKQYPKRDGVTTYCISGNHDATHSRNGFANIGETLGMMRDDIIYLGHNYAKVWLTDKLDVSLIHPTDGSSYSITHKLQQVIERNSARRSKLMFQGHYHKMAFIRFRDVYGWAVPSFQRQTDFMLDNSLTSEVGGLIITVKLNSNGDILSVNTEYVDYN